MKKIAFALVSVFLPACATAHMNRSLEDGKGGVAYVNGITPTPGRTAMEIAAASAAIDIGKGRRAQLEASAEIYRAYAPMYAGYMTAAYSNKTGGKDPRVDKLVDLWDKFSKAYAAEQVQAKAAAPSTAPVAAATPPPEAKGKGKKGKKGQSAQAVAAPVAPPAPAINAPGTDLKSGIAASKSFADLTAVFQRAAQDQNDPRQGQYLGIIRMLGSYANKAEEFGKVRDQLAAAY